MNMHSFDLLLNSPDQTVDLATKLALRLHPGDILLLEGEIGAGKTHFASAVIHALMDPIDDVPSPTFTLIQVYDTSAGEVWHADLYRLHSADECIELGLSEAFETAICLVEWPAKLKELTPPHALHLRLTDDQGDDTRQLRLCWSDPRWQEKLADLTS